MCTASVDDTLLQGIPTNFKILQSCWCPTSPCMPHLMKHSETPGFQDYVWVRCAASCFDMQGIIQSSLAITQCTSCYTPLSVHAFNPDRAADGADSRRQCQSCPAPLRSPAA